MNPFCLYFGDSLLVQSVMLFLVWFRNNVALSELDACASVQGRYGPGRNGERDNSPAPADLLAGT